jgi:hypothetical protein
MHNSVDVGFDNGIDKVKQEFCQLFVFLDCADWCIRVCLLYG